MKIKAMMVELIALEQQVSAAAALDDPANEMRVYEWRPPGLPELPAIWNWIDDGTYELVDTARGDDTLVIASTIGVKPSAIDESMGQLVTLVDIFRETVDPALSQRPVLGGTVRQAKRVVTRSSIDDFDGVPVMCMDMLVKVELSKFL